jgi:hypothetical protein
MIPADPTENLTPEERFQELMEILRESKHNRLWLAFLTNPTPGADESSGSSMDLAAESPAEQRLVPAVSQDILDDELRILLRFWLEMPLHEYLDDLEAVGPAVAGVLRDSRPFGPPGQRRDAVPPLSLKVLIAGTDGRIRAMPAEEMRGLFERIKLFAKRVHRAVKQQGDADGPRSSIRRENAMPVEVARVLYNLAGALALNRCGTRIIGIGDDRYRKNLSWALSQAWLDATLRPAFYTALKKLDAPPAP